MNSKYLKIVIALFIIIALVFGFFAYKKRSRNVIDEIVSMNDMINILIAGRDSYNDNMFRFFSLITINPVNKNVGITFIPPDYRIFMNDAGTKIKKISEVDFYYFDRIRYTLKKDIQMNVPFYVVLYSLDVIRSVNLIEGVNIFFLDQMQNISKKDFGLQYLDGEKIVQYINNVEQNSIYMKYDRILDIFLTLYNDKESSKKLFNFRFIGELFKNIRSNLMSQEIFSIAEIALASENIDSTLLPGGFTDGYYTVDEVSYMSYQQEFLTNLVLQSEPDSNVKLKILNGTNIPGLARKLRNDLIRDGMNVVEFATSNYPAIYDSIIICRKSDMKSVKRISDMTGIGKIYFVTDTTQLSNILIIVGEDMAK